MPPKLQRLLAVTHPTAVNPPDQHHVAIGFLAFRTTRGRRNYRTQGGLHRDGPVDDNGSSCRLERLGFTVTWLALSGGLL